MSIFLRMESCRKRIGNKKESITAFCKRMGIQFRQYQDICHGARPTRPTLDKMAANLNVSRLWLEMGEGPKSQKDYERLLRKWKEEEKPCQAI